MRSSTSRLALMYLAATLLPSGVEAGLAGKESRKKADTTDLQVQVTGVDDSKPVKGATVHLEWTQDGETVDRDATTNGQGLAQFRIPRGNFVVQVLAPSSEWETTGAVGDANQEHQTVKIGLKRKAPEKDTPP
jgi:hypothetical protein